MFSNGNTPLSAEEKARLEGFEAGLSENAKTQSATPPKAEDVNKLLLLSGSMACLCAVGAVVFAATTGRKGKFWWFIGGSMAGGAMGRLIYVAGRKA